MEKHLESCHTGKEGEDAAARHVSTLGWRILDRNWRHGRLELDLVCRDGADIVFLEVKTRATNGLTLPYEALNPAKQGCLVRAARAWLAEHNAWSQPCRFDLASVRAQDGQYHTELFQHVIELEKLPSSRCRHTAWQPW